MLVLIVMEILKKCAAKHDLVCLLHEKPFKGINGSGKHNNYSLATDTGRNLFRPGKTPRQNAQFLVFLAAFVAGVDEYQDFLRCTVASAGNDHRLGSHEAPPAVVSIYLGDELLSILEAIEKDEAYDGKEQELMRVGVHVLPRFPKDTTDRNRTSPFAFTGNKFEFRMLGSSASISDVNVVLNTAVASVLCEFADQLEKTDNFERAIHELVKQTIRNHKRILFNGNGYGAEWLKEAEERGLANLATTPDALKHFMDEKNVRLFTEYKVFSETEMHSRCEIMLENYCKIVGIEAQTMTQMIRADILPCATKYRKSLADAINVMRCADADITPLYEQEQLKNMSMLSNEIYKCLLQLDRALCSARSAENTAVAADIYKDEVIPSMNNLRAHVDAMETDIAWEFWPYPSYGEMLFSVR